MRGPRRLLAQGLEHRPAALERHLPADHRDLEGEPPHGIEEALAVARGHHEVEARILQHEAAEPGQYQRALVGEGDGDGIGVAQMRRVFRLHGRTQHGVLTGGGQATGKLPHCGS